jgi:hypothetical protein
MFIVCSQSMTKVAIWHPRFVVTYTTRAVKRVDVTGVERLFIVPSKTKLTVCQRRVKIAAECKKV